jgi:hypothetical protein
MKIEYTKNPCWADAERTMIDLTVKWDEFFEEQPFTASQNDVEAHGRAIFADLVAGAYGEIAEYVPPPEPVQPTVNGAQTL